MATVKNKTQGKLINGIWYNNEELKTLKLNKSGHNQYTPKAELVRKTEHPLKIMTNQELIKERIRCFKEKRYHQAFSLSYAQKISFIDRLLGICGDNKPMIEKAVKEFEKKEGMLEEFK